MVRSRARWYEHNEKPTKYCFNLARRNYNRKVINNKLTEDNQSITNQADVLKETNILEKLYSSKLDTVNNEDYRDTCSF